MPFLFICNKIRSSRNKAHKCINIEHTVHLNYRGSYMSVQVLLYLSNDLRKKDKMRGLPNIIFLFHNEFDKFNNTGAQMLDSILSHDIKFT